MSSDFAGRRGKVAPPPPTGDGARAAGPRGRQLCAIANRLNGASPVQLVRNKKNKRVALSLLSEDQLRRLLMTGKAGNYVVEKGDDERLIDELRNRRELSDRPAKKRKPAPPESDYDEKQDGDFTLTQQDEIIHYVTTTGRFNAGLDKIRYGKDGGELELKPWPELSLQGTIGEYLAREKMTKDGDKIHDLNAFQLNFPGLDHISNNKEFPFEQTKLHLSESTAKPETYLNHVKQSGKYAIKAVRGMAKKKKAFREMRSGDDFSGHDKLAKLEKAIGKLDGTSDDDIDGSRAQQLVMDGMRFTIPGDIFKKMPKKHRHRFLPLDQTVGELRDTMDALSDDYVPKKASGSKRKKEDEDYVPGKR
jgi:hypothetical protein